MDDEFKWVLVLMGFIMLACAIGGITHQVLDYQTTRNAMENGYIQKVEGIHILWVKSNEQ